MNYHDVHRDFGNVGVKTKIKAVCECGLERLSQKENVLRTIEKHGVYLCKSCGLKKNYETNPSTAETREKQRQGRLGKTHSKEARERMSASRKSYFQTAEGHEYRKVCSKIAAQGHAENRFENSRRKGLFYSAKNGKPISYNSSYELRACVLLENDPLIETYESQVYFEINGRSRCLDFVAKHAGVWGKIFAIEVKPNSRLGETEVKLQIEDSDFYAEHMGWHFEVWTEDKFGMTDRELRKWADDLRESLGEENLVEYRKELDRSRANRHYHDKIATDTVEVDCAFCGTTHTALRLTYDKNMARNGRYICEREGGKIAGSKPKKKKENPYFAEGKKQCVKCEQVKLLEEFGDDKSRSDGKASRCRECRR